MLNVLLGGSQGALSVVICVFIFRIWLTVNFYCHSGSTPSSIFCLTGVKTMWLERFHVTNHVKRTRHSKSFILTLIVWHLDASRFISIWYGIDSKFVLFWGTSRISRRWRQSSTDFRLRWPLIRSIPNRKSKFGLCASISRCDLVIILEHLLIHGIYLRVGLLWLNCLDYLRFIRIHHVQNWDGLLEWLRIIADELLVTLDLSLWLLILSLQVLGFLEIILNLRYDWLILLMTRSTNSERIVLIRSFLNFPLMVSVALLFICHGLNFLLLFLLIGRLLHLSGLVVYVRIKEINVGLLRARSNGFIHQLIAAATSTQLIDNGERVILRCFCARWRSLNRLNWSLNWAVICGSRFNDLRIIFLFFYFFLLDGRLILRNCWHRWCGEHLCPWACWSSKACLRSCKSWASSSSHSASRWTTTWRSSHSSTLGGERIPRRWWRLALFLVVTSLSDWISTKWRCCRPSSHIQEILNVFEDSTSILARNKLLFGLSFWPDCLRQPSDRRPIIGHFTVVEFRKYSLFNPNGELQEFLDILTFTICTSSWSIYQSWSGSSTRTFIIILTLFALLLLVIYKGLNQDELSAIDLILSNKCIYQLLLWVYSFLVKLHSVMILLIFG